MFVHDLDGIHRDECFNTTAPASAFDVRRIIETYTRRWSIETTFQETRSSLHLQTTRGWSRSAVLRAATCLFGLDSVMAMLYTSLPRWRRIGRVTWAGESVITFSVAVAAVRLWIWDEGVFSQLPDGPSIKKLPPLIRDILHVALAPAR